MRLLQIRWCAEYLAFRLFASMVEAMSVRQTIWWAENLAWLMTSVLPRRLTRYDIAYENLEKSFGDEYSSQQIDETIRKMWVHLFRMIAEIIQFPRKMTLESCREVMVFRNRQAAVTAMNSGRPVFVLGGHFGNWEASMSSFGVFGFRFGVVARKLDNPYLHRWFEAAREKTGHQLLLKSGGWDGMVDIMEAGGNLGLLCDQDAGPRGQFAEFFGRPASTHKSLALMALQYNALIVVGYGRRLPDNLDESRWAQFEIGCEEIIDPAEVLADATVRNEVEEITRRYSAALERAVRRSPEQYFWVHRRWKSAPRVRKQSIKKAA